MKHRFFSRLSFGTVFLAVASSLHGHPGHSMDSVAPTPDLVSPDHRGLALVAGIILFCTWWTLRQPAKQPSEPVALTASRTTGSPSRDQKIEDAPRAVPPTAAS